VVLQPHNDDGIIAIGGTILKLLKNGWKGTYVYYTDGRHGSNTIDPEKLKEIRKEEAKKEREFIGIKEQHDFCIEDGKLSKISKDLKERLVEETAKIIKNADVLFLPNKGEHHPDHRATYEIGKKALEIADGISILEVEYVVWQLPFRKFDPGDFEKIIKVDLSEEEFLKKIKAIRLHESQIKEGFYDEMVICLNRYYALLPPHQKNQKFCEVLGIPKINDKLKLFLDALESYLDITTILHGRESENIKN